MRTVDRQQVINKMRSANPWWGATEGAETTVPFTELRPRKYFDLFRRLADARDPRRAVILMGPRRVGKTVILFQYLSWLIHQGHAPEQLCYLDIQQPLYNGLGLEELLQCAIESSGATGDGELVVCFDEIQYLKDWEVHLKALVDSYPAIKFIASGSAAAALRLKSTESGAGRFTDFMLPPLSFYEYLDLQGVTSLVRIEEEQRPTAVTDDIDALNSHFLDYINFGGYPEAIFSETVRLDPGRYIRGDIIEKVLLRDLPSLYGIQDVQELNALFTALAYNTAEEVSLGGLSQQSGVTKNTIKRYLEYLESAFLIRTVQRVDQTAKRFRRANFFKVYLTNPSLRSALFSPAEAEDEAMGSLVETAVFAQWFHSHFTDLYYARWKGGEVDIVSLHGDLKPAWAIEVKWSDRYEERPTELTSLLSFCKRHSECSALVTTRTRQSNKTVKGVDIEFCPTSLYCYLLGHNIFKLAQRT